VPVRRLIRFPVVVLLALGACLGQVSIAAAQGLNVRDDAGVLTTAERQTIHDAAAKAPFSVSVWTVKGGYTGNKAGFVSAADGLITGNDMVVVAVDTVDKFSHVAARNSRLSSAATAAAKSSANSYFAQGQWGAGVNAAVSSLTSAAGSSANSAPVQGLNGAGVPSASQSSPPWVGLIIFVVIIGAIAMGAMALLRSRRRYMPGPQDGVGTGYANGPGYGSGPGYGGGPGNGRAGAGMGGMLAGGALGGIGGGLLGYELGRESGEQQGGSNDVGNADFNQGQGGFAESDQGGGGADWGGGGDFGGGGTDF